MSALPPGASAAVAATATVAPSKIIICEFGPCSTDLTRIGTTPNNTCIVCNHVFCSKHLTILHVPRTPGSNGPLAVTRRLCVDCHRAATFATTITTPGDVDAGSDEDVDLGLDEALANYPLDQVSAAGSPKAAGHTRTPTPMPRFIIPESPRTHTPPSLDKRHPPINSSCPLCKTPFTQGTASRPPNEGRAFVSCPKGCRGVGCFFWVPR